MKKGILYCLLPAVAGLALIVVAVLLSSSSLGGPAIPSVWAQNPPGCEDNIQKEEVGRNEVHFIRAESAGAFVDDFDEDDIFYEITYKNFSEGACYAEGSVLDAIEGGQCVFGAVLEAPPGVDVSLVEGCGLEKQSLTTNGEEQKDVVIFTGEGVYQEGEEVVLLVVVKPNERYGCVVDTACLAASAVAPQGEVTGRQLDCDEAAIKDTEVTCERRHVTPTPTPKPTSTPAPTNTPLPPAPTPTVKPLATIAPPPTGSGSSEGGWSPLTLALAMTGGCLLLVSGGALARKRIR
jgi:hypothetical protein